MDKNADPAELRKFAALAQGWWDPKGSSRPLHELNPLRLQYVERIASDGGRIRHVLEHLHARDDIEGPWLLTGQVLDGNIPVAHRNAGFEGVQGSHLQHRRGKIDAEDLGARARKCLG